MSDIELLDSTSNLLVAKYIGRAFPGVLIQGDTLKVILDDIDELRSEIESNDLESAKEIVNILYERLSDILNYYEHVLGKYEITLPYKKV